jgi:uncharacterized protein
LKQKQRQILAKIQAQVKQIMGAEGTGHDWWHARRVAGNAKKIWSTEPGADAFLVQAAAWLHDIKDWKFSGGDLRAGPREAARLLKRQGATATEIRRIAEIIGEVSYKGAGVKTKPASLEGKIVQDADRLDALGAIGLARCFAYGGAKNRPIYEPGVRPLMHPSFASYKKSKSHSINHFYEKLLLLKARMHTAEGRRLAAGRDRLMRRFLASFYREWRGQA